MASLGEALDYTMGSLDKPGRAVRGLLAGKPREALAALPFSDTLGITDPHEAVSGRQLSDRLGLTNPGDDGWGAWGVGQATAMATDPLAWIPGHMAAKALGKTGLGAALARGMHRFHGDEWGALGLKYDDLLEPPKGMLRTDPEWVNNKTWYHGTGIPGLEADGVDPRMTSPTGLFGRGFYKTADEGVARSYTDKGVMDASSRLRETFEDDDFIKAAMERAGRGEFDDWISRHPKHVYGYNTSIESGPARKANTILQLARSYAGIAEPGDPAYELAEMVLGRHRLPRPTVYQAQPSFGRILDLDRKMEPKQYAEFYDAMDQSFRNHPWAHPGEAPFAGLEPGGTHRLMGDDGWITGLPNVDPKRLVSRGITRESEMGDLSYALLRGLRSAGYDALTHTGGLRVGAGGPTHQVLIGLDPNDVLGLGRKTPYRQWGVL